MKKATSWIFISGLFWLVVGFVLLSKGITLLVYSLNSVSTPFLCLFSPLASSQESAVLILISLGLFFGYIKGRFVLLRTVKRVVERILSLAPPIKLKEVYTKNYLLLLLGMILLGISIRFMPISQDIKGFMYLTIGSALINGALLYFRFAFACRKAEKIN